MSRGMLFLFTSVAWQAASCGSKCSKSDRTGTYMFHQSEISGSCGQIGDTVQTLTNSEPEQQTGCSVTFERWSDNDCKLERNVTCTDSPNNQRIVGAGVSTQQDASGETLTGTLTMTVSRLDTGASACMSTYETTATRQ